MLGVLVFLGVVLFVQALFVSPQLRLAGLGAEAEGQVRASSSRRRCTRARRKRRRTSRG